MVVFSPNGMMVASGGRCIREIRLWDLKSGKLTATLPGHDEYGIRALTFMPDGKTLASAGHHGDIKLWDVGTGKITARLKTGRNYFPCAAFSPEGKTLAAVRGPHIVSEGGRNVIKEPESIKLFEVATGKELATLKGHTEDAWTLTFSPDGQTLACGCTGGTISLWDVAKANKLAMFQGHSDKITTLAFSADGKILVSGSADKTIKLWDLAKK
jgi:WD40 repeat protein